jgi:hypothetical protein
LYYDRFQKLLEDLEDADEPIAPKAAIRQFTFSLGLEFESIQNNFLINNLPSEWKTQSWPTLLALCQDYYNSIKPQTTTCHIPPNVHDSSFDCEAHQKKIREWFMNPTKFCQEIEREQCCHLGKCIYHLAKSHPTVKCGVKIECDEILAARKKSKQQNATSSTTGQLRHVTEETFADAETEEVPDAAIDTSGNDNNEESLYYFVCLTNHYHYLRLVKSSCSESVTSRHPIRYPIIAHSSANFHMFRDAKFLQLLLQQMV